MATKNVAHRLIGSTSPESPKEEIPVPSTPVLPRAGWLLLPNRARLTARSHYFLPITAQRYTSVVGCSVILPAAAAARMSLSDVNCCWDMVTK